MGESGRMFLFLLILRGRLGANGEGEGLIPSMLMKAWFLVGEEGLGASVPFRIRWLPIGGVPGRTVVTFGRGLPSFEAFSLML